MDAIREDMSAASPVHGERRLATILATDVVGYSRMMGDDEEATLGLLKSCRAIIDQVISGHGGRIFHTAGDAVLAEFASPVQAVRCAVEFQNGLTGTKPHPVVGAMAWRVGINLGDVIVDGDQLYGDGVNIAARLEGIAEPGGLCISGAVYEHIRNKLAIEFGPMGGQMLKNIAEPVPVYRLSPGASAGDRSRASPGARPTSIDSFPGDCPAIAVLPFDTFGADAESEAFADGLTEDLITVLASYRSFPVIARNSTFAYKGRSPDIRAAASELGAAYVLEGSVRFAGRRVRINAQLIDARSGHHLWAAKIDRKIDDIFDVQDEVTNNVAAIVEPKLVKAVGERMKVSRSDSLDAWSWCHKGFAALDQYTTAGTEEARTCFEQAIEIDPNFGRAWVGIAYAHHRDIMLEATDDHEKTVRQEMIAARRAIALDDGDSMAHAALGGAFLWGAQFKEAIAEGERALELNPSNVVACAMLATALSYNGQPEESFTYFDRAFDLNPQDPRNHIVLALRARAHLNARDHEAAIAWALQALRRRDDVPLAHLVLASAYGHQDDAKAGARALQACNELDDTFAKRWTSTRMYRRKEDDDHFLAGLHAVGF